LIAELKSKMPKRRFPVYKKPIPFAVPIFIGAITALAFGNVLLFLLPAYP
jgi:prepilin signal peptidase PulO-like enzyme (type II secretory pathway)